MFGVCVARLLRSTDPRSIVAIEEVTLDRYYQSRMNVELIRLYR